MMGRWNILLNEEFRCYIHHVVSVGARKAPVVRILFNSGQMQMRIYSI